MGQEFKQETLEEAAENFSKRSSAEVFQEAHKRDFIAGAKWQSERMYSEEDLKEAFGINDKDWICFEEWLEQFKKKLS